MPRSHCTAVLVAAAVILAARAAQAGPGVVFVDDSAPPGGNGSAGQPVQTIQDGIALLPDEGGVVAIHPGTYFGPIRVDCDNCVLCGLAEPVYDEDGYLAGFVSDDPNDAEVVVTVDYPLGENDPTPVAPIDLIALLGSGNEVRNLVVDSRPVPLNASVAAVSAVAEDEEFFEGIVFSHIIIRGAVDLGGLSAKADVLFEYVTALDAGFVGIWATGNGHAEVSRSHIARKAAAVVFSALDEQPKADNGPSYLEAELADSKLTNSNGFVGFFTEGVGLLVIGRKNAVNPDASSTIFVEASGNVFQDNRRGVAVWPVHGTRGFSTQPTLIGLDVHDNAYVDNILHDADVYFRAPLWGGGYYAANSTVLAIDGDGVFPDPADVDLGPVENGNDYQRLD